MPGAGRRCILLPLSRFLGNDNQELLDKLPNPTIIPPLLKITDMICVSIRVTGSGPDFSLTAGGRLLSCKKFLRPA